VKRLALLLLIGCGHNAAPPHLEDDLDRPGSATPTGPSNTAVDTGPKAPAPGPIVAALAGDGPRAFIADDRGLVEVAPSGKAQAIVAQKPGWCSVDARAQVVWFTGDHALYAFDLVDRRTHTIVTGDVQADTYMIDWGDQQLGGSDKVDYQVALALRLKGTPKVSSEIGCDGDQAYYCYGDSVTTPTPELVAKQRTIDALELADPAYVATVQERGATGSIWTPPPVPPNPPAAKPRVDKRQCEEASDCGALIAIPASPLWLVVTASSRGDFYHQTRELWDPKTGEFVSIANGAMTRSKKPPTGGDNEYDDLRIAPDGTMSIGGVVFDPAHIVFEPKGDLAMTCGWSNGGWRIGSPRE
jgi:hypothetical protein